MNGSERTPFAAEDQHSDPVELLTIIRERFRLIEEIDRQNVDLISGLSDAVRASAEARATASLDISVTLQQLDAGVRAREQDHVRQIALLGEQLEAANRDLLSLRRSIDTIESRLLQAVAEQKSEILAQDIAEVGECDDSGAVGTVESIVIFDVPNAVTALGIQRFLETAPGILNVVARSFESGRLRFSADATGSDLPGIARLSDGALLPATQEDGELHFRLVDPKRFGRLR